MRIRHCCLPLLWFLVGIGLAAALGCGFGAWLQSDSGTRAVSRWLSAQLQPSAPGTRVTLTRLKIRGSQVEIDRALWSGPDEGGIAFLSGIRLSARPARSPAWLSWRVRARVEQLDLAALDRVAAKGQWRAAGGLTGPVELAGAGRRLDGVNLNLHSGAGGGDLDGRLLSNLIGMMPAGGTREALLKALAAKATFHFREGEVGLNTEEERYVLHLRLDGDHLLEITLRVPKEGMELLRPLLLGDQR